MKKEENLTDGEKTVAVLILLVIFAVCLIFLYPSSGDVYQVTEIPEVTDEQIEAHKTACVEAYQKDFPEDKGAIYYRSSWSSYGDIENDVAGNLCVIQSCKIIKGWSKEHTYVEDDVDCSAISVTTHEFKLKNTGKTTIKLQFSGTYDK